MHPLARSRAKRVLEILAGVLAFISAALSALHLYRVRSTAGAALAGPKILARSLSPILALCGAIAARLGALLGAPLTIFGGVLGAPLSGRYVVRATAPHDGFQQAFGPAWEQRIPAAFRVRLLPRRWVGLLLPRVAAPRWQRDVLFWTVPGADRQLLHIVLAGGSAGEQLALLTAFAPDNPVLTPADVHGMYFDQARYGVRNAKSNQNCCRLAGRSRRDCRSRTRLF